MSKKRFIQFKYEEDQEMYFSLHPVLQKILAGMALYCHTHNMPFVITDTISTLKEDTRIQRVSSSHREGRAVDVSVKGWDIFFINDFMKKFEEAFGKYGAVSRRTKKPKLIVYHDHVGWHLHIQIHRKYKVESVH